MLDLDNFKHINDTHGHATGDCILVAMADTLRGIGDAGTVIARVGGEEFLVAEHNGTTLWNLMLAFAIGQKARAAVNQFGRQCISRGE